MASCLRQHRCTSKRKSFTNFSNGLNMAQANRMWRQQTQCSDTISIQTCSISCYHLCIYTYLQLVHCTMYTSMCRTSTFSHMMVKLFILRSTVRTVYARLVPKTKEKYTHISSIDGERKRHVNNTDRWDNMMKDEKALVKIIVSNRWIFRRIVTTATAIKINTYDY